MDKEIEITILQYMHKKMMSLTVKKPSLLFWN